MKKHKDRTPDPDRVIPYWKRAHQDWRFRVGAAVMFIAILLYVLSGDLGCGFAANIRCGH